MDQLTRLKIKLGIKNNDEDEFLNQLLTEMEEFILGYTRRKSEQWLPIFNSVQIKIAAIEYNRFGVEGIQSRKEGDISTSFFSSEDYPFSVIQTLNPYRIIKGLGVV